MDEKKRVVKITKVVDLHDFEEGPADRETALELVEYVDYDVTFHYEDGSTELNPKYKPT